MMNGDILVLGVPFALARLSAEGQPLWQKGYRNTQPDLWVSAIAAVEDGAAVLGSRFVAPGVEAIVLTRIDKNGELLWQRTYEEGDVLAEALTALPDGGLVFAWSLDETDRPGGERAEIVRVDRDGDVVWRHRFGPTHGTTTTSRILLLANGRLAVIGSTAPEVIAGFGADDWDIFVMLLDDD